MTEPQRMEAMGTLGIHLIGAPRIELDPVEVPGPRGRNTWGVLGFLLASRTPVACERLAELLFGDAERIDNPVIIERAHAWA